MPKEYLDKIRAKYPQYADIPDTSLAQQIIARHPEYQDVLGDMVHAPASSSPVQGTPASSSEPSYTERVRQATLAPGQKLNQAIGQFQSGNPIAGVANVANAGAAMLNTAVSPLTEAPIVGPPLKSILGAVPWLANKAVTGGENLINSGLTALGGVNPFKGKLTDAQAQQAQEAVHNVSANVATLPMAEALGNAPGAIAKAVIPESLPIRLYTSALKPRYTKGGGLPGMTRNTQTGLSEGLPVSEKGLMQLRDIEDQVNGAIAGNIQQGADAGQTVKVQPVVDALQKLKSKFELQATPAKALAQIDDAIAQFQDHPRAVNGEIPIDIAQKIKQGTYKGLAEKYGFEGSAAVEADKTVARSLKDQIAEQYPELTNLNARDGSLISLEDAMTRRVAQMRKSSIWPGRAAFEGAIGLATGRPAIAGVGLMDLMANSPPVLSKLAIALKKARSVSGPQVPPFLAAPLNQEGNQ